MRWAMAGASSAARSLFQAAVLVLLAAAARAGIVATGFGTGCSYQLVCQRHAGAPTREPSKPRPATTRRDHPSVPCLAARPEVPHPACSHRPRVRGATSCRRLSMRRQSPPCRLPAQAARLPARACAADYSSRLSFCCAVCRTAVDLAVGALPGPAGVPGARGGAGVGPARPGRHQRRRAWGTSWALRGARCSAGSDWWREQFPLTPLWRATLRALHAAGACEAASGRTARALHRRGARGADAPAGLAQPGDGRRGAARPRSSCTRAAEHPQKMPVAGPGEAP